MDPAGARALARRIEEQRRREAEAQREGDAADPHTPEPPRSPDEASPTVLFTPVPPRRTERTAKEPPGAPARVEIARPPAPRNRDVRMYSREWRREEIDGRQRVVTTIRCLALVEGEWQSRIIDVRVEDEPD